jgi:hypothetical protein
LSREIAQIQDADEVSFYGNATQTMALHASLGLILRGQ